MALSRYILLSLLRLCPLTCRIMYSFFISGRSEKSEDYTIKIKGKKKEVSNMHIYKILSTFYKINVNSFVQYCTSFRKSMCGKVYIV